MYASTKDNDSISELAWKTKTRLEQVVKWSTYINYYNAITDKYLPV